MEIIIYFCCHGKLGIVLIHINGKTKRNDRENILFVVC